MAVSTHSRLKAAGSGFVFGLSSGVVSTHSRLKAAGTAEEIVRQLKAVSTHSRLKAAGSELDELSKFYLGFNTQPPEGGWFLGLFLASRRAMFQHTAA